ncbi:recombinase family protein [Marinifilum flexuosum]|uniref:DNA invertase Pin-like site-specific DNA recombinase n=1 Tax=Marinifilum flexuosum TaxID=1117708 RepID=A0A419WMQ2_9BACT|nr:recombinase family protein [Marinifilum flexuosum]RKD96755.1 DNA invertase Pin-like site-specific DNA recombinase [Marinifilum flexuosum]
MRVYGYLRASTDDQDANRAKTTLCDFAESLEIKISAWFVENESGAKLSRPELFRLLELAEPGDGILIEQIDRITRLDENDWTKLKSIIIENKLKIISMDLPTSYNLPKSNDEFQKRILDIINSMMLDILAATARKDYVDRKRRQAEGVKKAKLQGKYKGRPEDLELQEKIESLLTDGKSYNYIQNMLGCARGTISKISKRIKEESNGID